MTAAWRSVVPLLLMNLMVFLCTPINAENLKAKAWQCFSKYPTEEVFPETEMLSSKPNTAIGFSGGGSRAYGATMGYLAALHELDLLKNVRYIGGISGGSWATAAFTYVQNVSDDSVFLGPIVQPEDIVHDELKKVDPSCARKLASQDLVLIALNALKEGIVESIADAWIYAESLMYFEPIGIAPGVRFSWSTDTVNEIIQRNPSLTSEDFLIPVNKDRPFPIIGGAVIAPLEGAPATLRAQNYSRIEFTPLYTGEFKNLDISYSYGGNPRNVHTKHVGGAIESFAFAVKGTKQPSRALSATESTSTLDVPAPEKVLDVAFMAGVSSYAPGSFFESIRIPDMAANLSMTYDYWSPSTDTNDVSTDATSAPEVTTMMCADGGVYENIPLISFMQRRVPKIVLFFMPSTPLLPFEDWDVSTSPETTPYSEDQVTASLSAYFGVNPPQARWADRAYEREPIQVFSEDDYEVVITALQSAQQEGNGLFATLNLTTIENTWWGIPAGMTFEITFSYLGRLRGWEKKLSKEMYDLAVPSDPADEADLSVTVNSGPFRGFPHFVTAGGLLNVERANLLADLTGWSVLQNEELFRHMLS